MPWIDAKQKEPQACAEHPNQSSPSIIQIIPNDDRVGHAMASWPGGLEAKGTHMHAAQGGTTMAREPCQAHALSSSCQHLQSPLPKLSSGETASTTAPHDHCTC